MRTKSGVRIETATVNVVSDYPGGEMWTGNGRRSKTTHVAFSPPFHDRPEITLSISSLDAGNSANLRVESALENATPQGFDIRVSTWENSKVATVNVTWLAIGE